MDVLWDTLGFAAKGFVVFVTVAASATAIFVQLRLSRRGPPSSRMEVKPLNERLRRHAESLRRAIEEPKAYKKRVKGERAADKKRNKPERNVWVLDFKGDVLASAVEHLRHEISALVAVAGKDDEVVLRLESPGGAAHSYGLAASQLARLKEHGIRLTVCVDKIAASGGYMMACVAHQIVAAPFAAIGSIGVAAPVPNIHRLLDKHGVDYENITSGKYKRTISFLAAITDEGRAKFKEQIEDTHQLFKDFVQEHRPDLAIDDVATGEYWHAHRAAKLGLVNRLMTSDDYLMSLLDDANLYEVSYEKRRSVRDRIASTMSLAGEKLFLALWTRLHEERPS